MSRSPIARNTRSGLVRFINAKGLKLEIDGQVDEAWANFSNWGQIADAKVGDLVTITIDDQGWVRKLVIDDAAPVEAPAKAKARRPDPSATELSGRPEPRSIRRLDPPVATVDDDWEPPADADAPADAGEDPDKLRPGWYASVGRPLPPPVDWRPRAAALQAAIALIGLEPDADRDPTSVITVAEQLLAWMVAAE